MNQHLQLLQSAITKFDVLNLKYSSGQGIISEREIEPLALFFEQNEWVLVAYCRLRSEKRQFLLSRIQRLEAIDKRFPPNQFSLAEFFKVN